MNHVELTRRGDPGCYVSVNFIPGAHEQSEMKGPSDSDKSVPPVKRSAAREGVVSAITSQSPEVRRNYRIDDRPPTKAFVPVNTEEWRRSNEVRPEGGPMGVRERKRERRVSE